MSTRPAADSPNSDSGAISPATVAAVEQALRVPLFDAIFNRRARRFAAGAELPGGPTAWRSIAPAAPLSHIEQELLIVAATGLSGLQLGDWSYRDASGRSTGGNALASFAGRAGASPCGVQAAQLFVTDDDGVSLVAMRGCLPVPGAKGTLAAALAGVRERRIPLLNRRIEIPREAPIMPAMNHWDVNVAGSTVFMPVSDITHGLINSTLLYLDEPHNYYIVDRRRDCEPLAAFPWLDRARVVDLAELEGGIFVDLVGVEPALMGENIYLAIQALGLGGWLFSAPRAAAVFRGLGFRFENDRPVGLDGLFEPLAPPYMTNPSDAIQAVYAEKWGAHGAYTSADQPFLPGQAGEQPIPRTSERALEAATVLYAYCLREYGSFPATVPAVAPGVWIQAHHLDLAFYDHYYGAAAVPELVRSHDRRWHP